MQHRDRGEQGQRQQLGFSMPRMEIPVFKGDNPRWWVRKCERMFEWYDIPEGRRVALATAYFDNVADAWY